MPAVDWGVDELLEALNGVVYVVDLEGTIIAHGKDAWSSEAKKGEAMHLLDAAGGIGLNLFESTDDEPTRESYRAYHDALIQGRAPTISFTYRCDAPSAERTLLMNIGRLPDQNGETAGFVYQSILLDQKQRPKVGYLDPETRQRARLRNDYPMLACCSYCMDVRFPAGPDSERSKWMDSSAYYRAGGGDEIALSHTVCPRCQDEVVRPMIEELRGKANAKAALENR